MRNKLVILLIISGLVLFFGYIIKSKFEKIEFVIEKGLIDIGKVKKKDKSEAIFKIKNTGRKGLIIRNVISDCHCTIPDWSSNVIKSGETYLLKVTYDNHKLGFFEQTVSVYIKGTKQVPLLIMRGTVVED